ncbi:MAG TPA: DUF2157 domain-containing protein [Azospirillaceae bacterium]|nr:DUF2157 domain-containing protein [Azospirillaceae bacterium]
MIDLHGRAVRARIEQWRETGLIDAATAERLLVHEAGDEKGGFHGALTLIGAGAVALGVAALVAANWDLLPIWLKLGTHVALNVALGVWAAAAAERRPGGGGAESLLIVLSGSSLAFIAHVGQSFQLQGDPFTPMAVWLALTAPFTVALGRSLAVRWLFTFGVGSTLMAGLDVYGEALIEAKALAASAAALLAVTYAAPLWLRGFAAAPLWNRHFSQIALAALMLATPLVAELGWRVGGAELDEVLTEATRGALVASIGLALAGAGFVMQAAKDPPGGGLAGDWRFAVFVAASPLYALAPMLSGGAESPVAAGAAFCFYWLAAAWFAHAANRLAYYRLAVVLVAIRLFAAFVEAFGGLLLTGGGLVLVGLLFLGMGWGTQRLLRRNAAANRETTP